MATRGVQYTGTEGCFQPALGLGWEPGQSRELDEALVDHLTSGEDAPFVRVALKVARAEDPAPPAEASVVSEPAPEPAAESAASAAEGSTT